MKRVYETPEFEILKCVLKEDVLSGSTEESISSEITPGGGGDKPIDLDNLDNIEDL